MKSYLDGRNMETRCRIIKWEDVGAFMSGIFGPNTGFLNTWETMRNTTLETYESPLFGTSVPQFPPTRDIIARVGRDLMNMDQQLRQDPDFRERMMVSLALYRDQLVDGVDVLDFIIEINECTR